MSSLKHIVLITLCSVFSSAAYADWASGEIRRLDPENKRLTIKHGEIKSIDMPPMTMVFYVTDPEVLSKLKVADAIEFKVVEEGKKFMVTEIRLKGDAQGLKPY
ncbi:MAG: copper-binding protein [Proteobacteria bacterium]|jgi:Cu(I)/Ag(I) efflux system periplasmic protein CusF|nr:copper-binding protein [Pseudomonadota bacterium]HCO57544.1 hypothetical protein [Burkholderiales bacterium]